MIDSPLYCTTIFKQQQTGEGTDCSFVFEVPKEDGSTLTEKKVIYGHKFILNSVSPYFMSAFKEDWKGDEPISITTFEYKVFHKLIKIIYLAENSFQNLTEALDLYVAAHFYQIECVLDMIRDQIPKYCYDKKPLNISELVDTGLKYQDSKLICFSIKYFSCIAHKIIGSDEFLQYSFDSINFLYQIDDVSADEYSLLSALEKLVKNRGSNSTEKLKSAIGAMRFLAIPHQISTTNVLSQEEKDFLTGKNNTNFTYLSKSKVARKRKTFFSFLSPETQYQLQEKFSVERCWLCKQYHNIFCCQKAKEKYAIYKDRTIYNYTVSRFSRTSMKQFIDLLQICQYLSSDPNFEFFINLKEELSKIFYMD